MTGVASNHTAVMSVPVPRLVPEIVTVLPPTSGPFVGYIANQYRVGHLTVKYAQL